MMFLIRYYTVDAFIHIVCHLCAYCQHLSSLMLTGILISLLLGYDGHKQPVSNIKSLCYSNLFWHNIPYAACIVIEPYRVKISINKVTLVKIL